MVNEKFSALAGKICWYIRLSDWCVYTLQWIDDYITGCSPKSVCKCYHVRDQRILQLFWHELLFGPVIHPGYREKDALKVMSHFAKNRSVSMFDVVTISNKVYVITLMENNSERQAADAIAKKKLEEYGYWPNIGENMSGGNGTSGGWRWW